MTGRVYLKFVFRKIHEGYLMVFESKEIEFENDEVHVAERVG